MAYLLDYEDTDKIEYMDAVYSVASKRLSDDNFNRLVRETVKDALIWFEEPRNWPSFESFLGYHIAQSVFRYQLHYKENGTGFHLDNYNKFVAACFEYARSYNNG